MFAAMRGREVPGEWGVFVTPFVRCGVVSDDWVVEKRWSSGNVSREFGLVGLAIQSIAGRMDCRALECELTAPAPARPVGTFHEN